MLHRIRRKEDGCCEQKWDPFTVPKPGTKDFEKRLKKATHDCIARKQCGTTAIAEASGEAAGQPRRERREQGKVSLDPSPIRTPPTV